VKQERGDLRQVVMKRRSRREVEGSKLLHVRGVVVESEGKERNQ
jgi:hypothetical protein